MRIWLRSIPFLLLPVVLLSWINWQPDVPARFYMEDPAALVKLPIGTAMMATIGISLWYINGFLALFAANLTSGRARACLLTVGLLCLWLGVDDMLLLHEDAFPDLISQEKTPRLIVEVSMFSAYALYVASWVLVYRREFNKLEWSFLLAALFGFAASLSLDLARGLHLFDPWSPMVKDKDFAIWAEDAPKILGLFLWTLFIWHFSKRSVQENSDERPARTNAN